ncbi:MAG: ABC transporter substrate-binding protein [Thermomicrobiales bacterium]
MNTDPGASRISDQETPRGRTLSRRSVAKLAALTLSAQGVAALLAACGGTTAPTATSAPASSAASPAAASSSAASGATGVAKSTSANTSAAKFKAPIVTQGVDPETLDPHFGESGISGNVFANCLEPLIGYDRKMNLVPVLAESWQTMDDKVTWRFKLRQNVQFQNGEPFNADAVKFTIDRTMDAALRAKGLNDPFPDRSGITKVNVIDPFTVDMVLKEPNIVLPVFLTFLYMLEPKYYTATPIQQTALKPIGTGPWQVTEWVKGDHLTLKSFTGYWRGDPGIPEITFKPVPEKATGINMLLAGEADLVGNLAPEDFPTIQGNSKLRTSMAQGSRRVHLGIPANAPKYKDRAIRQALRQAVDYAGIAKALLGPLAPKPRPDVLVAGDTWLNSQLPLPQYSADAAKKALQAANFPFSTKISVYSPAGRYLKDKELAQAVAGNLRSIGLQADAQILDWTVYTDKMRSKEGLDDLYLLGLGSRFYGPEDVSIVTTGQIWDQTHWITDTQNGPVFQKMYKDLIQTFDDKKQHETVNEMQRLFVEESVWLPLWLEPAASGVNKRLTWEDSGGGNRLAFWLQGEDPVKVTA